MKRKCGEVSIFKQPNRKRRSLRQQENRIKEWKAQSLCTDCQQIQLKKCETTYAKRGLWMRPLFEVFESEKNGCQGCLFFSRNIQPAAAAALQEHGERALHFKLSIELNAYGQVKMRIEGTKYGRCLEACRISAACVDNFVVTNVLFIRTDDKDVALSQRVDWDDTAVIPRLVSPQILTEETRCMVFGWLNKCAEHEVCRPITDQILPTRIIDVSNPEYPRLVETKGTNGQYTILSHCWGAGKGIYKTTIQRLPDHIKSIDPSLLPATFQHAIAITAHLGYRYL